MSDENVPKLRLKPKLAPDTPAAAESPASPTPAPEIPPIAAPVAESPAPAAPRVSRLKPRIAAEAVATPVAAAPAEISSDAPVPAAEPPADATVPPRPKLAFKTRDAVAPAPAEQVQMTTEMPAEAALHAGAAPAAAPNFPPPPGFGEPAPVAVSFPPPTAKFPPPPGARKPAILADAKAKSKGKTASGGKKSLVPVLGVVAVILLGGGYFAFRKFTAVPPPPPPRPVVAMPPPVPVQQAIEKAKAEQAAPLNEVVAADQASASTEKPATTDAAAPEVPAIAEHQAPAAPPPPPQASAAFKSWVDNLKILGIRGGANPRVFIEHTAYSPGDIVNPDLGISFVSFNPRTRMLLFKDKSGATVELRN
ncbi:MAG TPA: hypothetical protein VGM73_01820 [Candidatus Didemnitutus sp.]|jgi:hypothetical protein